MTASARGHFLRFNSTLSASVQNKTCKSITSSSLKRLPFLLLFCSPFLSLCFSQEKPTAVVSGIVVDDVSESGLPLANVFLARTTHGCVTDSLGRFEVKGIPFGKYKLVGSLLGYEPFTTELVLEKSGQVTVTIRLKERLLESGVVEVTASQPENWKLHLNQFSEAFVGATKNAKACRILNPEILDFSVDSEKGELRAIPSAKPMEIENRALGYHLTFFLEVFRLSKEGVVIRGIPFFKQLAATDTLQLQEWQKNRLTSYEGSLRHFLRSLVQGTSEEQGYLVYYKPDLAKTGKELVKSNTLLSDTNSEVDKTLRFKNFLEIVNTKKTPDPKHLETVKQKNPELLRENPTFAAYQTSWLELKNPSVTVNSNGYVYEYPGIGTYGYWAFQRIADWLPLDYEPSEVRMTTSTTPPSGVMIKMTRLDSLIFIGDSLLAINHRDEAKKAYEAAAVVAKHSSLPVFGLVKVALAGGDTKESLEHLQKLLKRNPNDTLAHYYAGISFREQGKESMFFNKLKKMLGGENDWKQGHEHFNWVIARDSTYRDVLMQSGKLMMYERKYSEGLQSARDQVRIHPNLEKAYHDLFRLYRFYLANESPAEQQKLLMGQDDQYSLFFLAEAKRRGGRLEEATGIHEEMLTNGTPIAVQPIYLSLARVNYANKQPEKAEQYYWMAVDAITNPLGGQFLFHEIKHIISDDELELYYSLKTPFELIQFFHSFWTARNPTPAAT